MFGGVYLASGILLAACTLILWLFTPGLSTTTRRLQIIDLSFIFALAVVVFQMVPLPTALVHLLSPAREAFERSSSLTPLNPAYLPLTVSTGDTMHAGITLLAVAFSFWTARSVFSAGGIRTFVIIIAWGAVALSIAAVAQHASGTPLVYGFWHPRDQGARPLGPFVNRNHFGTWGIMALCLCVGYLQWRQERPSGAVAWQSRVASWIDGRGMILQLAVVLLAALITLGASRSALVALAVAAGFLGIAAARRRNSRPRHVPALIVAALSIGGMLMYGDTDRLLRRIDETRETGIANRVAIWRDALPVVRDFTLTGVGAGAFGHAMRIYQTTPRTYYHNEAHNQYLQVLVEGGALLTLPFVLGVMVFIAAARERLRYRDEPLYWMRVASAGGLAGVAVQSIWETGLTLPANGIFAAALAGLLLHEPASTSSVTPQPQEGR